MEIHSLGRTEHRALSLAIVAALKDVCADFGVEISTDGGVCGTAGGVVKLRVKILNSGAPGVSGAQAQWNLFAPRVGLAPENFGQIFTMRNGKRYKIEGCEPSRRKNQISISDHETGKTFVCSVSAVTSGEWYIDPAEAAARALVIEKAIAAAKEAARIEEEISAETAANAEAERIMAFELERAEMAERQKTDSNYGRF
ncbi:MAG: hypothetical protein ACEQSB_00045 [Undibacterium sp.]